LATPVLCLLFTVYVFVLFRAIAGETDLCPNGRQNTHIYTRQGVLQKHTLIDMRWLTDHWSMSSVALIMTGVSESLERGHLSGTR